MAPPHIITFCLHLVYSEEERICNQSEHPKQDSRYRAAGMSIGGMGDPVDNASSRNRNASGNLWTRPNPLPQNEINAGVIREEVPCFSISFRLSSCLAYV